MTMFMAISAVLFCAYVFFSYRRVKTFLHIFQQEEYDGKRFIAWLIDRRAFDRRATLLLVVTGSANLASTGYLGTAVAPIVAALGLALLGGMEADPTKAGKKPLAMTARARRLLLGATGILVLFGLAILVAGVPLLTWILGVQIAPIALVLAKVLWDPFEARNNRRFVEEARDKLAQLHPTVVGVTGSFGKTSVKHILSHVLGTQAPTLTTPGSVNTELGITRIIREKLGARDRFFLCEMGAYGPGSIARLCRLAPPDIGVITAIGHAHYERFRSLDTVARAKFELAEAVVARGGTVVVSQQVLGFEPAREFVERFRQQVLVVGPEHGADLQVLAVEQTVDGTSVEIDWKGARHRLTAPLFGEHHGGNMALAFGTAVTLGAAVEDVVLALRTCPQIKHRSEVKHHPSGAVIIDDAYNSNPVGFAGGLLLLDLLRREGGRRILVTPGMVELGEAHEREHAKIGECASRHVDILLAIMPERLSSMIASYEALAPEGVVLPQPDLEAALSWIEQNLRAGDALLLENDLPDLYEAKLSI